MAEKLIGSLIYGEHEIPIEWRERLAMGDFIGSMAERLHDSNADAPGHPGKPGQQAIQPGGQQVGAGTPRHLQDLQRHGW